MSGYLEYAHTAFRKMGPQYGGIIKSGATILAGQLLAFSDFEDQSDLYSHATEKSEFYLEPLSSGTVGLSGTQVLIAEYSLTGDAATLTLLPVEIRKEYKIAGVALNNAPIQDQWDVRGTSVNVTNTVANATTGELTQRVAYRTHGQAWMWLDGSVPSAIGEYATVASGSGDGYVAVATDDFDLKVGKILGYTTDADSVTRVLVELMPDQW